VAVSIFEPVPPSPEVRQILLALYARRHEGVRLRRATASIGEWKPQEHYCFQNVEAWARFNPHHKRVDGFVIFDYTVWGLGFVRFTPHCVIENEEGELVDITPHQASDDYPFIRHTGTQEQFQALLGEQGTNIGLDLIL
jgi:hypothetical protein